MSFDSQPPSSRFRPEALQAISGSASEPIETPLVRPLDRWVVAVVALLIAGVLVWLVFGKLESLATGRGLVIRDSEFGIFEVAGTTAGRVTEVFFKERDSVAKGDLVATLHLPDLLAEISAAEQLLADYRSAGTKDPRIPTLEVELAELKTRHKTKSAIRSPRDGRVIEVVVSAGNVIPAGRTILRLESLAGDFEVLAYVPVGKGKAIKPGMHVRIVPSTVHAEVSGHLMGRVNYVSTYPVTRDYLISELGGNARLAEYLLEDASCIEVDMDVLKDPTSGEFLWSSQKSPPVKIESGLVVEAFVVIAEQSPISFILPTGK